MLTRFALAAPFAIVASAGLALAQVDAAAKQRVQDMTDAFNKLQSISFSVSLKNTGIMSMLPEMKGDVVIARSPDGRQLLHVEGSRGAAREIDPNSKDMTYVLTSDGTTRAWIDHEKKTVFERPAATQGADEAVTTTNLLIPRHFLNPALFNELLTAPTIELEAPMTSDGVECDVVRVKLGDNHDEYRAVIGKSDHLPRRLQRTFAGGGSTSQIWVLKDVRPNPAVSADMWTIKTPEGYTRDVPPVSPPPSPPQAKPKPLTAVPVTPGPSGEPVKVRAVGVSPDDLAPDFELKTPEGATVRLADLKGSVVVLAFTGSWAPQAKPAAAELQKVADRAKDLPVKIYALAVREPAPDSAAKFAAEHKATYGLLLGADEISRRYRVRGLPSFFVIGREGEVVAPVEWTAADPGAATTRINEAIQRALSPKTTAAPAPAPSEMAPAPSSPTKDDAQPPAANPGKDADRPR